MAATWGVGRHVLRTVHLSTLQLLISHSEYIMQDRPSMQLIFRKWFGLIFLFLESYVQSHQLHDNPLTALSFS
jgi:hypothetical protein